MRTTVAEDRMNGLLTRWESVCFLRGINTLVQTGSLPDGACKHFDKFRSYIFKNAGKRMADSAFLNFMRFPPGIDPNELEVTAYIPLTVLSWHHSSRRIFHMPSETQNLLDATSLERILWKEVRFPFNSFVVTLEDPLVSDDGICFDTFVVSKIDTFLPDHNRKGEDIWELRLLPQNLSQKIEINKSDRKKLMVLAKNRSTNELIRMTNFIAEYHRQHGDIKTPTICFFPDEIQNYTITESLPKFGEINGQPDMCKDAAIDSAIHIFVNLCIYLENYGGHESRSPKNSKSKNRRSKKSTYSDAFVSSESELFTVPCHFDMKKSTMKKIVDFIKESKASHEKRAHWRRAHWRRKPGHGNVPFERAPKDWIPMKLINAHKLPENTLPIATEAIT